MKKRILFLLLVTFVAFIAPTLAAPYVESKPISEWTCFDYTVDYSSRHPEWGALTTSPNKLFYGVSHMVNYKIDANDSNMIWIHDGLYNNTYPIYNWAASNEYYHFWTDSTPIRNYRFLRDNRETIIAIYNMSVDFSTY